MKLGLLLGGIGYLLMMIGGFAVFGLFLYGIYYTLFQSASTGLMLIGASMVGTFIVKLVSGILIAVGSSIGTKAIEQEEMKARDSEPEQK